jgi:hypothetical protein
VQLFTVERKTPSEAMLTPSSNLPTEQRLDVKLAEDARKSAMRPNRSVSVNATLPACV